MILTTAAETMLMPIFIRSTGYIHSDLWPVSFSLIAKTFADRCWQNSDASVMYSHVACTKNAINMQFICHYLARRLLLKK